MEETVKEELKVRFKNTFVFSLVLSWLVFNWRLIAILFLSELPVQERIEVIESNHMGRMVLILGPLVSAVIYTSIAPMIRVLPIVLGFLTQSVSLALEGLFTEYEKLLTTRLEKRKLIIKKRREELEEEIVDEKIKGFSRFVLKSGLKNKKIEKSEQAVPPKSDRAGG